MNRCGGNTRLAQLNFDPLLHLRAPQLRFLELQFFRDLACGRGLIGQCLLVFRRYLHRLRPFRPHACHGLTAHDLLVEGIKPRSIHSQAVPQSAQSLLGSVSRGITQSLFSIGHHLLLELNAGAQILCRPFNGGHRLVFDGLHAIHGTAGGNGDVGKQFGCLDQQRGQSGQGHIKAILGNPLSR